jgi:hypothetical protein
MTAAGSNPWFGTPALPVPTADGGVVEQATS